MPITDAIAEIAQRYETSTLTVSERAKAAAADLIVASGFTVTDHQRSRAEILLTHGITRDRLHQAYTGLGGTVDVTNNAYSYIVRMGLRVHQIQGLTIERLRQAIAQLGDA